MNRRLVGVRGIPSLAAGTRLCHALETAFAIRFQERSAGDVEGLSAIVLTGEDDDRGTGSGPDGEAGVRRIIYSAPGAPSEELVTRAVRFSDGAALDPRLRGHSLVDRSHGVAAIGVAATGVSEDGVAALASDESGALWTRRSGTGPAADHVAVPAPTDLRDDECLRDRLTPGHFLSLLPLIHFLREVTAEDGWQPPPLRAAFLLDDPNLHATSYGHLSFPDCAREAEDHDYHLAIAMIPLDGWFASRPAVRLFRESERRLSILIHGNDHLKHELARSRSDEDGDRMLAQALRRIRDFERRTELEVSRVMAAPHGVCSKASMTSLFRLGYEAIAISRPYPWRSAPPPDRPLAGWWPAEIVAGGLPVLPRYHLRADPDDRVLRAYLDHPLILYGHHDDVKDGMGILRDVADDLRRLGEIRWMSLRDIARSNFFQRRRGDRLEIRAFTRHLLVDVPEGVTRLVWSPVDGVAHDSVETIPVKGGTTIELERPRPRALNPVGVRSPAPSLWPMIRRLMTEGRDRVRPWTHRR